MVSEYSNKFSALVKQRVIESDWVAGIERFLNEMHNDRLLFLVTATPQVEIAEIISALNIAHYFQRIIGAPSNKGDAVRALLSDNMIRSDQAVMTGDSKIDYQAAVANNVPFGLRNSALNQVLEKDLDCLMIEDFLDE